MERVEGNRSSVLDGLGRAFGDDVVRYLRPVEYDSDDWRVRGYVSAPDRRLGSAELQYVYVNGDFIRGKSNALHREMIRIEADAFLGHGARNTGKGISSISDIDRVPGRRIRSDVRSEDDVDRV